MREKDVEEIRLQYKKFLQAWEEGAKDQLDECVKDLPFAYVSMYGHTYSREQIKEWFCNPGPAGSKMSILPMQDTILTLDREAQQYAVILGMITKGEEHIAFGGSFMNHYELTEAGWVLETIRFQLQSDDGMREETLDADGIVHRILGEGNRALMGDWLGVDERVGAFQDKIEHSGELVITPEIDAPWRRIQKPDNSMTDEEAVIDTFCHISAAYDYLAFMLAVPALNEDATVDVGGMFGPMNRRDALGYLKELRKSQPRSFTGLEITSLKLDGEKASAVVRVTAPEAYHIVEDKVSFEKDIYAVELRREKDRWTIVKAIRQ